MSHLDLIQKTFSHMFFSLYILRFSAGSVPGAMLRVYVNSPDVAEFCSAKFTTISRSRSQMTLRLI